MRQMGGQHRKVGVCDQCGVTKEVFEAGVIAEKKVKGEAIVRHRRLCVKCYRIFLGLS